MKSKEEGFRKILIFTVALVIQIFLYNSASAQQSPKTPEIIAQYGITNAAPENTLPAIQSSFDLGFGVAIGVHVTKDNKLVVIRDKDVRATTSGTGLIRTLNYSQMQELDAGSWFDQKFKGQKIPTLEQVFELAVKTPLPGIQIAIEFQEGYTGLEKELVTAIEKYNLTDKVLLYSVPESSVKLIQSHSPGIQIAVVAQDRKSFLFALEQGSWKYFLLDFRDNQEQEFDPSDIERAKKSNKTVFALFSNPKISFNQIMLMARNASLMGVNGIITTTPIQLYTVLREESVRIIDGLKRKREEEKTQETFVYKREGNMVLIPAGSFEMGSHTGEGYTVELPKHSVYLDEYYIDIYEVTIMEYVDFLNAGGHDNQYHRSMTNDDWCGIVTVKDGVYKAVKGREDYPVTSVSWEDATEYARWAGKRLPTEAEWEKAARGGQKNKRYPFGNYVSHDLANYTGKRDRDRWEYTSPVGMFSPNGYGLYDISGNVWEWVQDWFHPNFYTPDSVYNPVNDPKGPHPYRYRIIRGGSWSDDSEKDSYLRCSARGPHYPVPSNWENRIGFRCARTPDNKKKPVTELVPQQNETDKKEPEPQSTFSYSEFASDSSWEATPIQPAKPAIFIDKGFDVPKASLLLSLAVPGAGEIYSGSLKRGLAFLGVETLGWFSYFVYNSKGNNKNTEFEQYANSHWRETSYKNWINAYKTSHNGQVPDGFTRPLPVSKTDEYYEIISDLDQFSSGWDDYNQAGNYSQRRQFYKDMRHQSNVYFKRAMIAGKMIFLNHILSFADIIWRSRTHKNDKNQGFSCNLHQQWFNDSPASFLTVRYGW